MYALTDTYRFEFQTRNPNTGVLQDADSTPTATLVVNGVDTGTTVTITDSGTGRYKGSVSWSGLSDGDKVYVRIASTVVDVPDELVTPTLLISSLRADWLDGGRLDINLDAAQAASENAEAYSSIAAGNSVTILGNTAEIALLNDLDAADIRTAIGMATANLDTQLGAISGGSGGVSGGGTLRARVAGNYEIDGERISIVQGEEKTLEFIVEIDTAFPDATPADINVVVKDTSKAANTFTIPNADITRLCEANRVQVFQATFTSEDTATLEPGLVKVQVSIDDLKVVMTHTLLIKESLD